MASIFDSITVPSATLEVAGPSANTAGMGGFATSNYVAANAAATQGAPGAAGAAASYAPAAVAAGWIAPASAPAQAAGTTGSTGLVASMEPNEFAELVRKSGGPGIVLRTPIQVGAQRPAGGGGPPGVSRRYVFPWQGIVYVSMTHTPLNFGPGIQVVDCLAVAYDSKPLGGGNVSI